VRGLHLFLLLLVMILPSSPTATLIFQEIIQPLIPFCENMAFDILVRFELEGRAYSGNLVDSTADGFKVTKLKGSLAEGFEADGDEIFSVSKVCRSQVSLSIVLHYI
jgi:hypothetical protein